MELVIAIYLAIDFTTLQGKETRTLHLTPHMPNFWRANALVWQTLQLLLKWIPIAPSPSIVIIFLIFKQRKASSSLMLPYSQILLPKSKLRSKWRVIASLKTSRIPCNRCQKSKFSLEQQEKLGVNVHSSTKLIFKCNKFYIIIFCGAWQFHWRKTK